MIVNTPLFCDREEAVPPFPVNVNVDGPVPFPANVTAAGTFVPPIADTVSVEASAAPVVTTEYPSVPSDICNVLVKSAPAVSFSAVAAAPLAVIITSAGTVAPVPTAVIVVVGALAETVLVAMA